MDFASGLAGLEQAAASAQNNNNNNNNNRRPRDNNNQYGDDQRRYQPRQRHDYYGRGRGGGRSHHYHNNNNNSHERDLEGLSRMGYRLPRGPYFRPAPLSVSSSSTTTTTTRPFHICLLAITIDDLPYEAIWRAWAAQPQNATTTTTTTTTTELRPLHVSLVCHAKHPEAVTSPWLKQRMILQPRRIVRGNCWSEPEYLSHKPKWGSVEITRAMMDTLVAGLEIGRHRQQQQQQPRTKGEENSTQQQQPDDDPRFWPHRFYMSNDDPTTTTGEGSSAAALAQLGENIPPVDKFIFISETCIPVTTLQECGKALFPVVHRDKKPTITETTYTQTANTGSAAATVGGGGGAGTDGKEELNQDRKQEATTDDTEKEPTTTQDKDDKVIFLDTSWVNARNFNSPNTPTNKYERDQFSQIHHVVPKRFRWKADQWMVLSRTHAQAVFDLDHYATSRLSPRDELWNSFTRINASDEMYFPTALGLAGILLDTTERLNNNWQGPPGSDAAPQQQQPPSSPMPNHKPGRAMTTPWLERRKVTYTDWSMGMRNPACFTRGIKDFATVARLAREQKCLLARKFAPLDPATEKVTGDISVEDWNKEMETLMQQEQQKEELAA